MGLGNVCGCEVRGLMWGQLIPLFFRIAHLCFNFNYFHIVSAFQSLGKPISLQSTKEHVVNKIFAATQISYIMDKHQLYVKGNSCNKVERKAYYRNYLYFKQMYY